MICLKCKKPIVTSYYIDWKENKLCMSCYNKGVAQCVSCWQFCDEKAMEVAPGQFLCRHCQRLYIKEADCGYVVDYIKRVYASTPIGRLPKFNLYVASIETLQKPFSSPLQNIRGYALASGNDDYQVRVFRHLSRVAFADILAHEVLHLWQYARNIAAPSFYSEGFCNLGSYVVLKTIDIPNVRDVREARYRIKLLLESADPIYGDGFRYMLKFYEKGGWQAAIDELRRHHGEK